ncbi:MAG TPA: carboxypeptidase-like regulatory domain-containing protein [Tepidisphaeraceae bacterium]|jgi:hypothetical protein
MNPTLRRLCRSCWCALALLCGSCSQIITTTNNYRANFAWAASQQARIVVAGTLTDPQGQPLRGVRVYYDYVYLSPTGDDLPRARTVHESRTEPAYGKFRFVFSYAQEVHMRFTKPGYREERLDLYVTPQPGGDDSLARYPRAEAIEQEHLQIVLHRLGPATQSSR